MTDYGPYYALWRAITEEFGGSDSTTMGAAPSHAFEARMVKRVGEAAVQGKIIAYQPYPANPEAPPVLQFRPDAISREPGFRDEPAIHYEWVLNSGWRGGQGHLDAALHFSFSDPGANRALFKLPLPPDAFLGGDRLECRPYTFGETRFYRAGWTCIRYRFPRDADEVLANPGSIAEPAARAMEGLMEHTYGHLINGWGSQR